MATTFLDSIERVLFTSSRRMFVAAVLSITLFKTGIWFMPNIGVSQRIALDPFVNPFLEPDQHYLYWNWLAPFLAWIVGATSARAYFLFHLAFACLFTTLLVSIIFRRLPEREARIALLICSMIPVSGTVYYWVGMDAVVLSLMLVALAFPASRLIPAVVGVMLGLQHFEQGFVAGVVLLTASAVSVRMRLVPLYRPIFALAWIGGAVVGKLTLVALFWHWGVVVNAGRVSWVQHYLQPLMLQAVFNFQVIVWSMLGAGWLVLLAYVDRMQRDALPLLAGLLVCVPFLFAEDETRVVAIISFPLLAGYWLFDWKALSLVTGRDAAFLCVVWLVVPWTWTWKGIPRASALPYDVFRVLDQIFGPFPAAALDAARLFT